MTIPLAHFHYDVFRADSSYDEVDEMVAFTLDDEKKVRSLTFFGERFVKK